MKNLYKFTYLLLLQPSFCLGMSTTTAEINIKVNTNNITQMIPANIFTQKSYYVSGGITFTYTAGLFTVAPAIRLALQDNVGHANNVAYVAEIFSNDTTSATIKVYKLSTTLGIVSISEAASNDVLVHFTAAGI